MLCDITFKLLSNDVPSPQVLKMPRYSSVMSHITQAGCIVKHAQTKRFEPPHDKTNKLICAPSEDSSQSGHPPSLTRVVAVRMKKHWALSHPLSALWRLWSDWAIILLVLPWVGSFYVNSRAGVRFTKVFRTELGHKYILVECSVIALCLPVVSKLSRYKLVCYK